MCIEGKGRVQRRVPLSRPRTVEQVPELTTRVRSISPVREVTLLVLTVMTNHSKRKQRRMTARKRRRRRRRRKNQRLRGSPNDKTKAVKVKVVWGR